MCGAGVFFPAGWPRPWSRGPPVGGGLPPRPPRGSVGSALAVHGQAEALWRRRREPPPSSGWGRRVSPVPRNAQLWKCIGTGTGSGVPAGSLAATRSGRGAEASGGEPCRSPLGGAQGDPAAGSPLPSGPSAARALGSMSAVELGPFRNRRSVSDAPWCRFLIGPPAARPRAHGRGGTCVSGTWPPCAAPAAAGLWPPLLKVRREAPSCGAAVGGRVGSQAPRTGASPVARTSRAGALRSGLSGLPRPRLARAAAPRAAWLRLPGLLVMRKESTGLDTHYF